MAQSFPESSTQPDGPDSPTAVAARRPGRPRSWAAVVAIALLVGLLSGALSAVAVTNLLAPGSGAAATVGSSAGAMVSNVRIDESSAVTAAAQKVSPSVVVIQSSGAGGSGVGSGFVFDPNGWILTNKHVVTGATSIRVVLNDTRTFSGKVYGTDPLTDLAIVKIDATGLSAAPLGSSANLVPGQLAIAIGDPLGSYANTITTGVVSGLGRQIRAGDVTQSSSEQLNNLIQTDAAINPGNSGGPLLNSSGQVIGINTAVASSAQGIGFAIPVDVAKPIMRQALAGKPLTRPWIGVYYQPVTKALAAQNKLSVDHGAWIQAPANGASSAVVAGSPASSAGLKDGDVIVSVDGVAVDERHDLSSLIVPHNPGDVVTLRVVRGTQSLDLSVTLGTLPSQG